MLFLLQWLNTMAYDYFLLRDDGFLERGFAINVHLIYQLGVIAS